MDRRHLNGIPPRPQLTRSNRPGLAERRLAPRPRRLARVSSLPPVGPPARSFRGVPSVGLAARGFAARPFRGLTSFGLAARVSSFPMVTPPARSSGGLPRSRLASLAAPSGRRSHGGGLPSVDLPLPVHAFGAAPSGHGSRRSAARLAGRLPDVPAGPRWPSARCSPPRSSPTASPRGRRLKFLRPLRAPWRATPARPAAPTSPSGAASPASGRRRPEGPAE